MVNLSGVGAFASGLAGGLLTAQQMRERAYKIDELQRKQDARDLIKEGFAGAEKDVRPGLNVTEGRHVQLSGPQVPNRMEYGDPTPRGNVQIPYIVTEAGQEAAPAQVQPALQTPMQPPPAQQAQQAQQAYPTGGDEQRTPSLEDQLANSARSAGDAMQAAKDGKPAPEQGAVGGSDRPLTYFDWNALEQLPGKLMKAGHIEEATKMRTYINTGQRKGMLNNLTNAFKMWHQGDMKGVADLLGKGYQYMPDGNDAAVYQGKNGKWYVVPYDRELKKTTGDRQEITEEWFTEAVAMASKPEVFLQYKIKGMEAKLAANKTRAAHDWKVQRAGVTDRQKIAKEGSDTSAAALPLGQKDAGGKPIDEGQVAAVMDRIMQVNRGAVRGATARAIAIGLMQGEFKDQIKDGILNYHGLRIRIPE